MTLRRPPSQRNQEATGPRLARALQSMAPGTYGGRVANASPISFDSIQGDPSDDDIETPIVDVDVDDEIAPAAPAGLSVSSSLYTNSDGRQSVQATFSWTPVTTNSDGTTIADLDVYRAAWRTNGTTDWSTPVSIDADSGSAVVFRGFVLSQHVDFRVRAIDKSGNKSAWTTLTNQTLTGDGGAPNQPSLPSVTPVIAGLKVSWNGLDNAGGSMPSDFSKVLVYFNTTGLSSGGTLWDSLTAANGGQTVITNLSYSTNYYAYFIAYDRNGNASAPSVARGPYQILHVDGSATGDITNFSADIITGGTINATFITVLGRLTTATGGATNVARVEFDGNGISGYGAPVAGVTPRTFWLDRATGNLTLSGSVSVGGDITLTSTTGVFRSSTGSTRVEITNSSVDRVTFWQTGTNTGYLASTTFAPYGKIVILSDATGMSWVFVGGSDAYIKSTTVTLQGEVSVFGDLTMWTGNIDMDHSSLQNVYHITGSSAGNLELNPSSGRNVTINQGDTASRILLLQAISGTSANALTYLGGGGATLARIQSTGEINGLSYSNISDARVKSDIEYVDRYGALDQVRALRPARFRYNHVETNELYFGFVAQDVQPVIPDAVVKWHDNDDDIEDADDGMLAMRSEVIVATLVLAVQELADELDRVKEVVE